MPVDPIMQAAIDEYHNASTFPHWNLDERIAARGAVRGVMVRLGRYAEFCNLLDASDGSDADAMS